MITKDNRLPDDEAKFMSFMELIPEQIAREIYAQLRHLRLEPKLKYVIEEFCTHYSKDRLMKFDDQALAESVGYIEAVLLRLNWFIDNCFVLSEELDMKIFEFNPYPYVKTFEIGAGKTMTSIQAEKEIVATAKAFLYNYKRFLDMAIDHFKGPKTLSSGMTFILDTTPMLARLYVEGKDKKSYEMKKGADRYRILYFLLKQKRYVTTKGLANKFGLSTLSTRKRVEGIRDQVHKKCGVPRRSIIESDGISGYRVENIRVIE